MVGLVDIYTHTYMHTYAFVYIIHAYINTYTFVYIIHTYIHPYINTCIRIHSYTSFNRYGMA